MSDSKISYSQTGEDLIIDFIFDTLQINTRRYLDIGANEPISLSNTYLFYERGHTGVCVEPDPDLCEKFLEKRPNDKILQFGIGETKTKLPLYLMNPNTLNTFSKHESDMYQKYYPWVSVIGVIEVRIKNINEILKKYFKKGLDILSIDTEGLDLEIIKSIDFNLYKPAVICVETAVYTGDSSLEKNTKLIQYLRTNNYFVYADTFVNTIFVNYGVWQEHNGSTLKGY